MKIKKIAKIIFFIAITAIGITTLIPVHTFADDICGNSNISPEIQAASGCPNTSVKINDLPTVIQNILNAIIGIAGVVSVVFIVVGGIQYITSTGDPGKTKKAKDTILYALIGLIVCALSFAIVNFVISQIIYNGSSYTTQSACEDAGHTWVSGSCQ